jgi:hypothetical protein
VHSSEDYFVLNPQGFNIVLIAYWSGLILADLPANL